MFSFRRLAILLALSLPVMSAVQAQSSSSSSSSVTPDESQDLAQNQAAGDAQQTPEQNQGQISVQERIRLRRSQRRATAIHDAYDHRWESYLDMGYLRFTPGPGLVAGKPLQRLTYYAWETGLTRFSTERLGYTLDRPRLLRHRVRGAEPVSAQLTRGHAISQYDVMAAPSIAFICSRNSPSPAARWAAGPMATSPATPMAFRPSRFRSLSGRQHLCRQRQRDRRVQRVSERRPQARA